jgi:homoserine acetyltransferase
MMNRMHPDYSIFDAGDVVLQSGRTFPSMRIAYKTYGTLAPENAEQSQINFKNACFATPAALLATSSALSASCCTPASPAS